MAHIPSLEEMPPDRWLAAMYELRQEFVEEVTTLLDVRTEPERLAGALQELFDDYWAELELETELEPEADTKPGSIEVQARDNVVQVWLYPTEHYLELVYSPHGYWWFHRSGAEGDGATRRELHHEVANALLECLPWGKEDFIEMAAIEFGSGAG
ncbi:MAG: hypothetical protein ACOCV2_12685 [Persicimonas sp.]